MEIATNIFVDGNLIKNSTIKIRYKGKFAIEFSNHVYISFGYGTEWKNMQEKEMIWDGTCFFVEIDLIESGKLNFCFKNDFGNWDNNNGNDYTMLIASEEITEKIEKNISSQIELEERIDDSSDTNNLQEKETKKTFNKEDLYKSIHVSEKIDARRKYMVKEKEESLFEYVNNQKRYNEKSAHIGNILNIEKFKNANNKKDVIIEKDINEVLEKRISFEDVIKLLIFSLVMIIVFLSITNF